MAVKVKREEGIRLHSQGEAPWGTCPGVPLEAHSRTTLPTQEPASFYSISGFQPGPQNTEVQKLVLEPWIPPRQEVCLASAHIESGTKLMLGTIWWVNEQPNVHSSLITCFKTCYPKYLTFLPSRGRVYVSSLNSGLCGCLTNRIWWKLCYASFQAGALRNSCQVSILSLGRLPCGTQPPRSAEAPGSWGGKVFSGCQLQLSPQLTATINHQTCKCRSVFNDLSSASSDCNFAKQDEQDMPRWAHRTPRTVKNSGKMIVVVFSQHIGYTTDKAQNVA